MVRLRISVGSSFHFLIYSNHKKDRSRTISRTKTQKLEPKSKNSNQQKAVVEPKHKNSNQQKAVVEPLGGGGATLQTPYIL